MEQLESTLNELLKTGKGMSILLELDTESYLEIIIKTIKKLQEKGLSGVYVSIQRPFKNISSLLEKQGVDLNKLIFIDVASAVSKETQEGQSPSVHNENSENFRNVPEIYDFPEQNGRISLLAPEKCLRCVHISPELDVDELVKAIYTSFDQIKSKKFIFIDSLTTFALHKPISEILRFSEFLIRRTKNEKDIVLLLSVAKDLSHKKFIQDVIAQTDKTIEIKT